MEITIAKNAGFCFGVRRATNSLEAAINSKQPNERIYTLGKLIHNDVFNARLAMKGVSVISEGDIEKIALSSNEKEKVTLVIRAHGVTAECEAKLAELIVNMKSELGIR